MSYFLDEISIFGVIEPARRGTAVKEKTRVRGRKRFWVVRGAWPLSEFQPCVPALSSRVSPRPMSSLGSVNGWTQNRSFSICAFWIQVLFCSLDLHLVSGVPARGKSQGFVLGNEGWGFTSVFLGLPSVKCHLSNKWLCCSSRWGPARLRLHTGILHAPESVDCVKEKTVHKQKFCPWYVHF